MERLDRHGDSFRTAATEVDVKTETTTRVARPPKSSVASKHVEKQNVPATGKKPGPKRKSKADKVTVEPCCCTRRLVQNYNFYLVSDTSQELPVLHS